MTFEELRAERKALEEKSDKALNNIDAIISENYRVADIAHNAKDILNLLDAKFEQQTGLNSLDITFLLFATALQCIRQYVFTSFHERLDHKSSAEDVHKAENKLNKKIFGDIENETTSFKRYYVPTEEILLPGVPYDAIQGSQKFDLGYNGGNHRFKTLGHDPLLGWVFGTANILTNTLTDVSIRSFHVKKGIGVYQNASTSLVLEKTFERAKKEPIALALALIKQALHLESDKYSKVGLPIPAVSILTTPELSQTLTSYAVKFDGLLTVGKQASGAIFINTIIAMIHRLFYDESKYDSENLYEVKTRKILSYSNLIASVSNVLYVAVSVYLGNDKAINKLDIGGLIVTIYRLVNDYNFIKQVKEEFVYGNFNKMIQGD